MPNAPGQYERSTVDQITQLYGKDIWEEIGQDFDIVDLGEGKHRIRVLKSKEETK